MPTRPPRSRVRADVLDAARAAFAEHGYQAASLTDIAGRAGFSKGAVYSNFTSKDELFLTLLTEEVDADIALVSAPFDARVPEGPEAALAALAAGLIAIVGDGSRQQVFAEFRAAAARDADLAARLGEVRQSLVTAVAERLGSEFSERGLELLVPAQDAALLLLSLVNGLAMEQIGRSGPVVSVEAVTAVLSGLIRPLDGVAP